MADPTTHAIPADAGDEAEQLFTNLAAILAAAGASLTDVVRVGIVMRALQPSADTVVLHTATLLISLVVGRIRGRAATA